MDISSVNTSQPAPTDVNAVPQEIRAENRQLIQAVKSLNSAEMFGQNSELTFVLDRETRRPLLRIVDRETKEVIRQIPPEHALRMAEDIRLTR